MKALRSLATASLAAMLLVSSSALAAETSPSPFKFEFHGFVSTSIYYQDALLGPSNGQGSLYTAAEGTTDEKFLSADIRQTRLNLSLAGPKVLGATPKGVFEFDLFGGASGGAFGDESLLPRIRVAYAELNWGNTVLLIGQQNQLSVGQIPASAAHIAFPSTYTAGTLGWRYPGIMLFHNIPFGSGKIQLAGSVQRGSWADTACLTALTPSPAVAPGAGCPGGISFGEASGIPQLQARLMIDGKSGSISWLAYGVGHFDRKDMNGWNNGAAVPAGTDTDLTGWAGEVGAKLTILPITVAFNAYAGEAVGQLFGQILQFADLQNVAGWAQVGVNLTKEFSLWGQYGLDRPDEDDAERIGRLTPNFRIRNQNIGAMARYMTGGYTVALEWFQTETRTAIFTGTAPAVTFSEFRDLTGNQVLLTGMYTF